MSEPANDDWLKALQANYARNKAYSKQGAYATTLNPGSEVMFRKWLAANRVRFDPAAAVSDYDMRGFWQALQTKDPRAVSSIDPHDHRIHYSDYWKTPYHATFSADSQWAAPGAPKWNKEGQLITPAGQVVFDPPKVKSSP